MNAGYTVDSKSICNAFIFHNTAKGFENAYILDFSLKMKMANDEKHILLLYFYTVRLTGRLAEMYFFYFFY